MLDMIVDYLKALPQYLLPQHLISSLIYLLTRSRKPWLKNLLIRSFIRHFRVDMSVAEHQQPEDYADFNSFFTRALQPQARPLPTEPDILICPVDGTVSQAGEITEDRILQAKKHNYSTAALLGDTELAREFRNGSFITVYLSPRDYHRIHMPVTGLLRSMHYIPGKLFSVNPATTHVISGLFARNERVVNLFQTSVGPMALVQVGAINVGSIDTVWAGTITPPYSSHIKHVDYADKEVKLERGEEMGRFNMGSTVILLFSKGAVKLENNLPEGRHVTMGQAIGTLNY